MDFINEEQAVIGLADTVIKGGISLYNAIKYIYSIGESDFYKISIKDTFKVVLNNITDGESLKNFGLRIDGGSCREMQNTEYDKRNCYAREVIQICGAAAHSAKRKKRRRPHDRRPDTEGLQHGDVAGRRKSRRTYPRGICGV